jgi:regulator of RNase E activity RraA
MSSASRARGATGVVVDGGIRDGRFLYTMKDWVVFCRYISPIESRFRYRIKDLEVPISVSGSLSSQVRINPGDWIVGDVDGVLVIANAIALKLLERAEDLKDREDKTRADIVGGVSVRDIHGKYGTV